MTAIRKFNYTLALTFFVAVTPVAAIGTYTIEEGLQSITSNSTGISSFDHYVTGMPDSQTWVNHDETSIVGLFPNTWYMGAGEELVLETSFHSDNYKISLMLEGGGTSATIPVETSDWTHLGTKNWSHVWPGAGSPATWVDDDYIVALSFSDFGISPVQGVTGVAIEFLTTAAETDFAGAYITDNASVTLVPEPTTVMLLHLGILACLMQRNRTAKSQD